MALGERLTDHTSYYISSWGEREFVEYTSNSCQDISLKTNHMVALQERSEHHQNEEVDMVQKEMQTASSVNLI